MKLHDNLLSWALLISNGIVTALFSPLANLHLIFFLSGVSFPVIDETIFAKCKKKATTLLKLDSPQIFPSSGSERIHIVAWKPFEKSQCLVPFRNWNQDFRNKNIITITNMKKPETIWQKNFSFILGHVYRWPLNLPFFDSRVLEST